MEELFYTGSNKDLMPVRKRARHGKSKTKTYFIWKSIIQRCTNINYKEYCYYGKRGIGISHDWIYFEKFLLDMGESVGDVHIDRIDNNKGYSKNNCRWATPAINMLNRRKCVNKKRAYRGVYLSAKSGKYEAQIRINLHNYHIGSFASADLARDEFLRTHKEWYGVLPLD